MNSIKAFLRPVYPAMALALLPYPVMAQSHSENPPLEHPHDYQHDRKDGITLAAALQLAGVSSPVIAAAQAQMDIATGNEQQAAYGLNPNIGMDVENFGGSGAYSGFNESETTLMVSQPFELGGKRGARKRAARALTGVANLESQIMQADLIWNVRSQYTKAVAAREGLLLAQDILERNRELARIAQELVDAGRESPLRALRAQAGLGEAQANVETAKAADMMARLALAEIWGGNSPPDAVAISWLALDDPENLGDIADTLTMKHARAQIDAANAQMVSAKANATPDLNIGVGVRRFELTNDTAFVFGASMDIPLSNRNQGNIAAARATVQSREAELQLVRLKLIREENSLIAMMKAAQSRVDMLSETILPKAEEALRLARLGYRYGKFSLIDVLDAAAVRDDARLNLIRAKDDLAQSAASLLRLTTGQMEAVQ